MNNNDGNNNSFTKVTVLIPKVIVLVLIPKNVVVFKTFWISNDIKIGLCFKLLNIVKEGYINKIDNKKYKIVCRAQLDKQPKEQFQFEIQDRDNKKIIKTIQFRIENDKIYLTNLKRNIEYEIEYKQNENGDFEFKNTITGNSDDKITEEGLFYIMDKYSNFNGDLNNPNNSIKKTFEELADLQLIRQPLRVQQGQRKEIIEELRELIDKAKFIEHKSEKGLYYANINDNNTLLVDINNKEIKYNETNNDNFLHLNTRNMTKQKFIEEKEQFEKFICPSNDHSINIEYYDIKHKKIKEKSLSEDFNVIEEEEEKEKVNKYIWVPTVSNAKVIGFEYEDEWTCEFIKDSDDTYDKISIESIKMHCNAYCFLNSIEFNCKINGEKKNIIMEVNKNTNEREYFYINNDNINENNKIKIDDPNTINNIEDQVKNFQLSFYDNLYKGYREKYQTNILPSFQTPIDYLFFALNTNYYFEKIKLSEEKELEQQIDKYVQDITDCIRDMKINNKTTCYVSFGTKTHATLLRIKKDGEDKYSFVLYNSGGKEKIIKPFFDKENEIGEKVSKLLAEKLNIGKENIKMKYKETAIQRGPTCLMNSAFMAFMKDSADNLKNKYKQLQTKEERLNNWKDNSNKYYQQYTEEKNKMKDELFKHELTNIVEKYRGKTISIKNNSHDKKLQKDSIVNKELKNVPQQTKKKITIKKDEKIKSINKLNSNNNLIGNTTIHNIVNNNNNKKTTIKIKKNTTNNILFNKQNNEKSTNMVKINKTNWEKYIKKLPENNKGKKKISFNDPIVRLN